MKRIHGFLIALLLVVFAATPAFAQGSRSRDHVCFGGSTLVKADETPDSVVLFGCGARIQSGAYVRKDVVSFGGDVVIEQGARVGENVVSFGGGVTIAGEVKEDVAVFGGRITLEPTAVVGANVIVFGGFVDQKEGATVRGRITRGDRSSVQLFRFNDWRVMGGTWSIAGLLTRIVVEAVQGMFTVLALAALGALTVAFWPSQVKQVGEVARDAALPSLGVGCLTTVVAFTLGLLLIVTICGIPVALILWLAFALAWLVGWIAVGRLVGEKILQAAKARGSWDTPVVAVVVGVILLTLIGIAPLIGWFVALMIATLGIGAVVLTRFGTRPYPPSATAPTMIAPVAPVTPSAPVTSGDAGPSI